ncbi:hypothetical protein [Actinotalea solisilvae]|uniref:hypothetical protein n=1 Tax=Actinotalea solisilvae TaxID=2072922 RepID=UPI0018F1E5AF|nr:hypothetical protein [Actinotalea solisilvae]
MARRPGRTPPGWLGRWVAWVGAGELAGFAVPATVVALVLDRGDAWSFAGAVGAGLVEGALLGVAQARVLRDVVRVPAGRWVLATSAAAGLAWAVGMLPGLTWRTWSAWPPVVVGAVGAAAAGVLLASIGTAQWLLLRTRLPRAGWWVAGTAGAWVVGLGVFAAVTSPLWQPGQATGVVVAIGLLGGAAMAFSMAGVTGLVLRRLVDGPGHRVSPGLASVAP